MAPFTTGNFAAMKPRLVAVDVSGSGKTTVGVAAALDVPFRDTDDLHPAANVAKMAAGIALTDDDRMPRLALVVAPLVVAPLVVTPLVVAPRVGHPPATSPDTSPLPSDTCARMFGRGCHSARRQCSNRGGCASRHTIGNSPNSVRDTEQGYCVHHAEHG